MGLSLTSIHIYGDSVPADCGFNFRSFSENWFTCIDPLPCEEMKNTYAMARTLSKKTSATVLWFYLFDSDMIWMTFFKDGKIAASYTNDGFTPGKKLFSIPALVGYEDGNKRRLSNILAAPTAETLIALLEEFLGVDLLFEPYLLETDQNLSRTRGDTLYKQHMEEEKRLSGKNSPFAFDLVVEYRAGLYPNFFTEHERKKSFFVRLDLNENGKEVYSPVQFTGPALEPCDLETFRKAESTSSTDDPRFEFSFGRPCKVTFTEQAPAEYRGQTWVLPNGYFAYDFLPTGELILLGNRRLIIMDHTETVLAKLTHKGDVMEIRDNYVLLATDSFGFYGYQPNAKIFIYKLSRK